MPPSRRTTNCKSTESCRSPFGIIRIARFVFVFEVHFLIVGDIHFRARLSVDLLVLGIGYPRTRDVDPLQRGRKAIRYPKVPDRIVADIQSL